MRPPVALTVAGTDSGGGAGIAADLKTFAAHGVWGTCAVTAVTAQNTIRVDDVQLLGLEIVAAQIRAVATDMPLAATKTGMLGHPAVVRAVAMAVEEFHLHPLVVDPVATASSGERLLSSAGLNELRDRLLPLSDLVTPNLAEAAALARWPDPPVGREEMQRVGEAILGLGPKAVLVTGGHLLGAEAADLLVQADGSEPRWFSGPRLDTPNTHGTGCVLSAAIAAGVGLGAGPGAVNPSGSSPP